MDFTLRCRRSAGLGFTLVELLVVVAIIALLLAILLPALGKARAVARSAVCMSVQRQYGLSNQMYAEDNDSWTNPARDMVKTDKNQWYANDDFAELMGVRPAGWSTWKSGVICPDSTFGQQYNVLYFSYGMNIQCMWDYGNQPWGNFKAWASFRMSAFDSPANSVYLGDCTTDMFAISQVTTYYGENANYYSSVAYRHNETANLAYYDGHTETFDMDTLHQQAEQNLTQPNMLVLKPQ